MDSDNFGIESEQSDQTHLKNPNNSQHRQRGGQTAMSVVYILLSPQQHRAVELEGTGTRSSTNITEVEAKARKLETEFLKQNESRSTHRITATGDRAKKLPARL